MNRDKRILIMLIVFILLLIIGGSYAYWLWNGESKNIIFNTSDDLSEYIIYDEGKSTFVGGFTASNDYTSGIHSTVSIKKTNEVSDVLLMATINMDIKSIGEIMLNSTALKWVVTSGNSENIGTVLNSGNFLGVNVNDTMCLLPSIEITTTEQEYTIWIWLDSNENPNSNMTMETLDTIVWTEINQIG